MCMVNYWSKLINGKDSKLSLTLYKYMYIKNSHGQYQSSWFDNVKIIVVSVISGRVREINFFYSTWLNIALKQRLFDQFQQERRSNMENSSKGLCYKYLK